MRTPDLPRLAAVLGRLDVTLTPLEDGAVQISGTVRERIGEAAAAAGVVLHELTTVMGSLEDAYLDLTHDEVEYRAELEEVVR